MVPSLGPAVLWHYFQLKRKRSWKQFKIRHLHGHHIGGYGLSVVTAAWVSPNVHNKIFKRRQGNKFVQSLQIIPVSGGSDLKWLLIRISICCIKLEMNAKLKHFTSGLRLLDPIACMSALSLIDHTIDLLVWSWRTQIILTFQCPVVILSESKYCKLAECCFVFYLL